MADESGKKQSVFNGWVRQVLTAVITASLLAIPALFFMYADVDSLKTQAKELMAEQKVHTVAIAKSDEKFDAIRELLREIRDEQKEIRKELSKKKDK